MRVAILGYEGIYEIDDAGRVYSLDRITTGKNGFQNVKGKELSPILNKANGYFVVNLAKNGKIKQHRLHILTAKHFIPNPDNKPTVNHKLGDKSLNGKNDLEWATHQEQMSHAAANNLTAKGERNGGNKISDAQYHSAFSDVMSGAQAQQVAACLGINRNTLTKAFYRLGYAAQWRAEALRRKATRLPGEFIPG